MTDGGRRVREGGNVAAAGAVPGGLPGMQKARLRDGPAEATGAQTARRRQRGGERALDPSATLRTYGCARDFVCGLPLRSRPQCDSRCALRAVDVYPRLPPWARFCRPSGTSGRNSRFLAPRLRFGMTTLRRKGFTDEQNPHAHVRRMGHPTPAGSSEVALCALRPPRTGRRLTLWYKVTGFMG